MTRTIAYRLSELPGRIPELWQLMLPYHVIALQGSLGAGKTTFMRALGQYLKVEPEASSPTFSLINEYHYLAANGKEKTIFHSDWYRLKDVREAIDAGIEDMLAQNDAKAIIEWPERAMALLPEETLLIRFEWIDETQRKLYFENIDEIAGTP